MKKPQFLTRWFRSWVWALILFFPAPEILHAETFEDWYRKELDYSLAGDTESAIEACHRGLRIRPDSAETHHALAVLYYEKKEGVRAVIHFRAAEKFYRQRKDTHAGKVDWVTTILEILEGGHEGKGEISQLRRRSLLAMTNVYTIMD